MSQIKKNYIYNLIFKLFSILFNILSIPYLSRVLGAEKIGQYSYTNAIVSFFMLFCLLGIYHYGNRLIASERENKVQKSKQFFSVYVLQIICSLITCLIYIFFICFFANKNQVLLWIQVLYLLSSLFDISWFFYGNEEFIKTIVIGIIEKAVCLILLFLFVKKESDFICYIWIMSACTFLKNICLLPFLKKELVKVKISYQEIFCHLKPCLILFLPILAVNIYKVVNKIILGAVSGNTELGYFEQADKIMNIPLCIITSLAIVIFPKMSHLLAKGNEALVKKHMEQSMNFVMFLVLPISFGLIAVADDFVFLLLGSEFMKTATLMKGLAISIIFIAWASVLQNCYLIVKKMDKQYAISVCVGALISIVLNIAIIPYLNSIGAMLTTIITEFIVTLWQTIVLRKKIPIQQYLKNVFIFFIKSCIMMIIVYSVSFLKISNLYLKLFLQIILGVIVYFSLNKDVVKQLIQEMRK